MKYILYGNGGSGNHGCEAIVRGTAELMMTPPIVYSKSVMEDKQYGLEQCAVVSSTITKNRWSLRFIYAYLKMKLTGNYIDLDVAEYLPVIKKAKKDAKIAFSVGGDNYCYKGTEIYRYLNRAYHACGLKTVLWGCSVEPSVVMDPEVAKDMCRYDLIVARESITYNALEQIGANVISAPDPAFFMKPQTCDIDKRLLSSNIVGINISPLILKCAKDANVAYQNYLELIRYILDYTDNIIALIPHVVWDNNDDRVVLRKLYEDAGRDNRIVLVEDHTAPELKYIISRCKIFVGARTHATIAAYSSLVPTIAVGYSVKARGIAKDLFGTEKNYVIPVQELEDSETLLETYKWIADNQIFIHNHLKSIMSSYMDSGVRAKEKVLTLF